MVVPFRRAQLVPGSFVVSECRGTVLLVMAGRSRPSGFETGALARVGDHPRGPSGACGHRVNDKQGPAQGMFCTKRRKVRPADVRLCGGAPLAISPSSGALAWASLTVPLPSSLPISHC